MRRQPSLVDVGTPRALPRSSSGVWWKLGDAAAADASEVERRLRAIAEEEAAVRVRMERRRAAARRGIIGVEVAAFAYGLWTARRRRGGATIARRLVAALTVPALAAAVLAAFARFRSMLDARDRHKLQRLRAERKARIGSFRGSHHNLQKLIEKYDPDAAADGNEVPAATQELKRTHSRLSFHVGDE